MELIDNIFLLTLQATTAIFVVELLFPEEIKKAVMFALLMIILFNNLIKSSLLKNIYNLCYNLCYNLIFASHFFVFCCTWIFAYTILGVLNAEMTRKNKDMNQFYLFFESFIKTISSVLIPFKMCILYLIKFNIHTYKEFNQYYDNYNVHKLIHSNKIMSYYVLFVCILLNIYIINKQNKDIKMKRSIYLSPSLNRDKSLTKSNTNSSVNNSVSKSRSPSINRDSINSSHKLRDSYSPSCSPPATFSHNKQSVLHERTSIDTSYSPMRLPSL